VRARRRSRDAPAVPRPSARVRSRTRRACAPLPSPWLPLRRRSRRGPTTGRATGLAQELGVETTLPVVQLHQRAMIREVEVERRQRDVAVVHRAHVGALEIVPPGLAPADPVVAPSPGIGLLHDLFLVDAVSEACHPDSTW